MKSIYTLCAVLLFAVLSAYKVHADVPDPGFNSLFIGHSFFMPFAQGMPDYSGAAGITGHSQSTVFSGGATGAPQALWENASKRNAIQTALNSGEVELLGMTYHPDYPTIEGYVNWIDYALAQNPTTRFALALPWLTSPGSIDAESYANVWNAAHATAWHGIIDTLRALYPGVEIYCIPYGQSAGELRLLFADNNLPDVQNLSGNAATSLFSDAFGHPGHILRDLGRLVWLNAIYDVDLATYAYGPAYNTDLYMIAQSIMAGHDPSYDAAYHVDADGDRVGDTLDNCPLIPNGDQLDTDGNGRGDVCEGLPPGC